MERRGGWMVDGARVEEMRMKGDKYFKGVLIL